MLGLSPGSQLWPSWGLGSSTIVECYIRIYIYLYRYVYVDIHIYIDAAPPKCWGCLLAPSCCLIEGSAAQSIYIYTQYIHICVYLPICLSVYLCIYIDAASPKCWDCLQALSCCLIEGSAAQSIYIYTIYPSMCRSTYLSVCLSMHLYRCCTSQMLGLSPGSQLLPSCKLGSSTIVESRSPTAKQALAAESWWGVAGKKRTSEESSLSLAMYMYR